MSILYRVYGSTADCRGFATNASYATARGSTAVTDSATSVSFNIGQTFSSPNYGVYQGFFQFDTSAVPSGKSGSLSVNATAASTVPGDLIEISETTALTNKIAGGSLSSLTQLGSFATTAAAGRITTALSGTIPVNASLKYVLAAQNERNNVAPTGAQHQNYNAADQTGTTSDPYLDVLGGTAWDFVAAGTSVEATATSHVLTEPAGAASGDLLVACIGSRIASTTSITLPSGWTLVAEAKNNNTLSTGSALPSGMMAYILRGGSAPSYTFTHPVAPNVALGRVVAYRNVHQTTPTDSGTTAVTTGTAITSVSVTGLTTTADDDLIVALTAGGQEAAWSAFAATDPATSSGTTSASVLDPIWGQWLERADVQTTTGNDTSLAIFDAVKQTAGATGNFTATASVSAGHVVVAGSFKLVPAAPTGDTYDEDQEETLSAAETVAMLLARSGPIAETVASADTVAGLLDATRGVAETAAAGETLGGLLVTEKAIAETLAAAETLTGGLAFDVTVAETAAAAETLGGLFVRVGAIAETTSAAETVGSLLTFAGAIAETASAAETTDAELVAAPGVFNEIVAETAGAADTLGSLVAFSVAIAETAAAAETIAKTLTFTGAIAETASAAETITKTVSYTGAIAETAAAAETLGGLSFVVGAIAETASAVETQTGLFATASAIAEVAAADDTHHAIVVPAGGTLYEEAVLETLAANDTVAADVIHEEVALGGPGAGPPGPDRRRFEIFLLEDEDEEKPRRKRKLRLKKAELEEKVEAAVEYIEAGSPQPMSQQAMVAQVSTLMGLDALLEIDRRRVERTIYRYLATLLAEEEEEEGVAMMLLAA